MSIRTWLLFSGGCALFFLVTGNTEVAGSAALVFVFVLGYLGFSILVAMAEEKRDERARAKIRRKLAD